MEKTIPTTLIEIISSTNFLLDAWKKLRKTNRLSDSPQTHLIFLVY